MYAQGLAAYKKMRTENASQGQLIVMSYEGAIRFLERAAAAMAAHDIQGAHNNLIKAQDIVLSLNASLNMNEGGEIAITLQRLYHYMAQRLVQANSEKDPQIVTEIIGLLSPLLDAWRQVVYGSAFTTPQPDLAITGAR